MNKISNNLQIIQKLSATLVALFISCSMGLCAIPVLAQDAPLPGDVQVTQAPAVKHSSSVKRSRNNYATNKRHVYRGKKHASSHRYSLQHKHKNKKYAYSGKPHRHAGYSNRNKHIKHVAAQRRSSSKKNVRHGNKKQKYSVHKQARNSLVKQNKSSHSSAVSKKHSSPRKHSRYSSVHAHK